MYKAGDKVWHKNHKKVYTVVSIVPDERWGIFIKRDGERKFETGPRHIVLEDIYNSPLYQALKEEE